MKNQKVQSKLYIMIGLLLMLFQLLFDTLNVSDLSIETKTTIGAIGILLSIISSGYKQYFDPAINSSTLWIQVLLFVAYVSGGLLDKFDMLPLNDDCKSIARIVLTFTVNSIPIIIKNLNSDEL